MKVETSSGILVYRILNNEIQVLLGKCGGPKWETKSSIGAWNIPKGHVEDSDGSITSAALREFNEETSLGLTAKSCDDFIDLGEAVTKTGKHVKIFALEKDFIGPTEFKVPIKSNMCDTEWPKGSGKIIQVPELSEAYYFKLNVAKRMIFSYQKVFLDRLETELAKKKEMEDLDISEQIEGGAAATPAPIATPGITSDSVFGSGRNCDQSLVQPKEKKDGDPGLTTSDLHTMYVLTKDRKRKLPEKVDLRKYKA